MAESSVQMSINTKTRPERGDNNDAPRAWEALTPPLAEWILDAVHSLGFERMTPVQASTIPLFTGNKDPVVEAVTGSGKTLAFLIPIISRLLALEDPVPKHHVGAMIISPTRELATQIHTVLLQLLAFHPPSAAAINPTDSSGVPTTFPTSTLKVVPQLLTGGSATTPQSSLSEFLTKCPNILIATPGRLLDLLSSPHVHCPASSFQVLVLDEADRLLNLGFKTTLTSILSRLPKQRRTGLFSASVSEAVEDLVRVGLRNPYRVNVKVRSLTGEAELRTPAALSLKYLTVPADRKLPTLLRLLSTSSLKPQRSIAYLPTCAAVGYISNILPSLVSSFYDDKEKLDIIPLHGHLSQTHRTRNLARFTSSTNPALLLTTDVAARGLDIPEVDLVVQLDPPSDPAQFLHRSGRAGRAGRKGMAVAFLLPGRESDEYPGYLAVRGTPVAPLTTQSSGARAPVVSEEEARIATKKMREVVKADRGLHDKSHIALPSYVQAYRKHTARSIFRVGELPYQALAEGWGLLRMPKMPECKGLDIDRYLGLDIDWPNFAYKDKPREKKRRAEYKEYIEQQGATDNGKHSSNEGKRKRETEAWSEKKGDQSLREARKEKRERKRIKEQEATMSDVDKLKNAELQSLIAQVRAQNVAGGEDGEFEGFD